MKLLKLEVNQSEGLIPTDKPRASTINAHMIIPAELNGVFFEELPIGELMKKVVPIFHEDLANLIDYSNTTEFEGFLEQKEVDYSYSTGLGFKQKEVDKMLAKYGLSSEDMTTHTTKVHSTVIKKLIWGDILK